MDKKDLNNISIAQLKQKIQSVDALDNDLIITNNLKRGTEMFKYPCRLDAVVMALCTEGEIEARINLKQVTAQSNTLVLNTPENIIQITDSSKTFKANVIAISLSFLSDIHKDIKRITPFYMYIKNNPLVSLNFEETGILQRLFDLIYETVKSKNTYNKKEIICGLINAFMYKVSSILHNNLSSNSRDELFIKSRQEIFFEKFMHLLTQYHKKERSVGFYAHQLNITPKYLSSLIKNISGKSAAEWIDDYVILEAKTQLKYSDMNIQEIAYSLNFSTQSFFGKYFKHHTGISPSEYKLR
ncbi:MAG: helix-turn-helix domain-containing protein [Bacteroidales bacterium]|nr:helix-turn-helix domain-containing protein [Bacteroidales bacterium]